MLGKFVYLLLLLLLILFIYVCLFSEELFSYLFPN